MKIITAIRTKPDGTTRWDELGLAFENSDGSLTLNFHYFPVGPNIRIQVRDKKCAEKK